MDREESRSLPPPLVVQDPVWARLLLDPLARQTLAPFFGRDTTVGEAAAQLGVKPNTLLRRVQRLVAGGLLHVTGEERRAGRSLKRYRVASERFFVPFALTDAVTLEDLLMQAVEEPNRLIARGLAQLYGSHAPRLGYLVTRLEGGRIAHDLSLDGLTPIPYGGAHPWFRDARVLRLRPAQAEQFGQELQALLDRYADPQGARYLAFLAFAPLPGRR
ncbi:helix-turn-helix domain-containing protein [Deinococcus aluminii]|uniref:Uncharacterized protein n=1 Tax=Deinococcus aluminii TaxID=1656885 RepID=A0ABP9XD32_9DEIO